MKLTSGQRIDTTAIAGHGGKAASDVFVVKDLGKKVHVEYGGYCDEALIPKSSITKVWKD